MEKTGIRKEMKDENGTSRGGREDEEGREEKITRRKEEKKMRITWH